MIIIIAVVVKGCTAFYGPYGPFASPDLMDEKKKREKYQIK
jgi:hypothetical protein